MFEAGGISQSDKIQYICQQLVEIKWIDFLTSRGFKMLCLNL